MKKGTTPIRKENKDAIIDAFRIEPSIKKGLYKLAEADDRSLPDYLRVQLKKLVTKQ